MKNKTLLFWCAVLFLFAGTLSILYAAGIIGRAGDDAVVRDSGHSQSGHESGSESSDAGPEELIGNTVTSFALTDQRGQRFESQQLRGKIWIASVFFANCPGFCRTQNQQLQQLQNEFGPQGVEFVSITCDPESDTVQRLAQYARGFNADPEQWHFLTGQMKELQRVGRDMFQLMLAKESHSDRFVVVNREGKIHDSFRSTDALQMAKLRKLLNEMLATQPPEDSPPTSPDTAEANAPVVEG